MGIGEYLSLCGDKTGRMVAGDTFTCPVAAAPYRAYELSLPAPQRSRPGKRSAARQRAAGLAAAVGRPPARGDEKRQMEMVLCRLADNKINLRPGKDALAPGAGKPRPGFRC